MLGSASPTRPLTAPALQHADLLLHAPHASEDGQLCPIYAVVRRVAHEDTAMPRDAALKIGQKREVRRGASRFLRR